MKTLRRAGPILILIGAILPAPDASAHEFWLAPSEYSTAPRRVVKVGAHTGDGFHGPSQSWAPPRCVRFVARAAHLIDLSPASAAGDSVWSRFSPTDDGGAMLAFESTFTPIELPGVFFDRYLRDEGLDAVLESRALAGDYGPGRERYRRCAKTWLQGGDNERATAALGLPLEIVPDAPPGQGPALGVTVLRGGRPLCRALVRVWRSPLGPDVLPVRAAVRDSVAMVWEGRTNEHGRVIVPTLETGEWLVSLVDMVPSGNPREADWESTWASLTFAIESRQAPGGSPPGDKPSARRSP
jgi:hypothetical protein